MNGNKYNCKRFFIEPESSRKRSEEGKICACFGSGDYPLTEELKTRINAETDKAINDGIETFLFAGKSEFSDYLYDLINKKSAQNLMLDLKRMLCFIQDKDLDGSGQLGDSYKYWLKAIDHRNRSMVDMSDLVMICDANRNSLAYKAYSYAAKTHKKTVNLALPST